jgi:hypothetical protein
MWSAGSFFSFLLDIFKAKLSTSESSLSHRVHFKAGSDTVCSQRPETSAYRTFIELSIDSIYYQYYVYGCSGFSGGPCHRAW